MLSTDIPLSKWLNKIISSFSSFYFMGSWLQTPRRYNYRKSVEPLFAYSSSRGSGMTLHTRINNECPRRYVHRREIQRIKHTKGHLPLSCFGLRNFAGFSSSKTSANKRLFIMSAKSVNS